jgi:CubicO group peptidase (beta-lactamase class C family)
MVRCQARRRTRALIGTVVLLGIAGTLLLLPPLWTWPAAWAVKRQMATSRIPGLAVAVARDGAIRWSAAFGLADIENAVPVERDTIFRFASISKPITAVAVMQLAERGMIDLDAPIQRYVPSFPEKPWPVTPRHLLGHMGGVRHYKGNELESVRRYPSLVEALAIFKDDPLVCKPGTRHVYSTYGYNLLGAAIERVSGQSYEPYIRGHIFAPSGMTHSGVADIDEIIPGRARGYIRDRDGRIRNSRPADLSNKAPGAGLSGTAEDLVRFALAVQRGTLVGPESKRLMWTRQRLPGGMPIDYGLGWSLLRFHGREEVCHAGRQQRVSSLLYTIPDRGLAVAILCNLEGVDLMPLARRIGELAAPER